MVHVRYLKDDIEDLRLTLTNSYTFYNSLCTKKRYPIRFRVRCQKEKRFRVSDMRTSVANSS